MRVVSKVSLGLMIVFGLGSPVAMAEDSARVSVTLKDHKFSPAEPSAPAGKPIVIEVTVLCWPTSPLMALTRFLGKLS